LACSNTEGFIREIRGRYGRSGWSRDEWVPATVMFKVTDSADYIRASLTAMMDDSGGPKFWPIIRLDGDPHGSRISQEDIERFRETLGKIGEIREIGEIGEIYIEFANEPNHKEEWGEKIDPEDYREKLGVFIGEIREIGEIGGVNYKVLNGALDQRAGNTKGKTMEALDFWEGGGLVSLVGDLDGYAFNNYSFENSGRYSKEGWKIMRGLFGMNTNKPVFLLEYGKDPNSPIGLRQEFIRDEYLLEVSQDNPAVEGVAAVTPLVCVDKDCARINTAIFGKNGQVGWEEASGGGSCIKKKVEGCDGKAGDRDDRAAADDNECADKAMRPFSLRGDKGISSLGSRVVNLLCRFPGVGPLCRWGKHGSRVKGEMLPQRIINKPPDNFESPSAGTSVYSIPGAGIARKIVGYFVSKPDTGYLQAFLPNGVLGENIDIQDAHNLVAGCGGNLGEGGILIPYGLCKLKEGKPRDRIDIGQCKEGPEPYCSIENLLPYFDNNVEKAANASQICNIESGGNPFALNAGCESGTSVDYSVGLFQINLLAHCPGAFRKYTWDPPSCTIAKREILEECKQRLFDPEKNIEEAKRISSGGTNWSPWAGAAVCGIE
jgi:hypothetical protein